MRLFCVALVGLLSLASLGCSSEQIVESQQVISDTEVVHVDDRDADDRDADDRDADDSEAGATEPPAADAEERVVATETDVAEVPDAEAVDAEPDAATTGDGLFPTVVGATASTSDDTSWSVNVTLSSEYDSPERYADAWRVLDADDNELGIRLLGHDHANEQPFTRSTSVDIPADVNVVFIEGRDQVNGWSGERYELALRR